MARGRKPAVPARELLTDLDKRIQKNREEYTALTEQRKKAVVQVKAAEQREILDLIQKSGKSMEELKKLLNLKGV